MKKGVKLRSIIEVTLDNISYVKKLMELFETRHTPELRSNFGIADKRECLLHSLSHQDQPLSHVIHTNAKALVEAQCSLFETLWKNAIPAEEKVREIEECMKPPFTDTLRDSLQIQKVVLEFVNSAKQEVLMLLYSNTVIGNIFLKRGYEDIAQKNATIVQGQNNGHEIKLRIIASNICTEIGELMARKKEKAEREGLLEAQKLEIHLVDTIQQHKLHKTTNQSILEGL